MQQITCPKCSGSLEQVVYQGIEVDCCRDCGGIWFDALEAETLKKIKGSEKLDRGTPEKEKNSNQISGEVQCPKCNAKMFRMLDIDRHRIWYEKCSLCGGVWLDAGEFKKFKQNFRSRSLWHWR